jgi:hypothetical protein
MSTHYMAESQQRKLQLPSFTIKAFDDFILHEFSGAGAIKTGGARTPLFLDLGRDKMATDGALHPGTVSLGHGRIN